MRIQLASHVYPPPMTAPSLQDPLPPLKIMREKVYACGRRIRQAVETG